MRVERDVEKHNRIPEAELLGFAVEYDYNNFNEQGFLDELKTIKNEYRDDNGDTHFFDIESFAAEGLSGFWQEVEVRLGQKIKDLEKNANDEEKEMLKTGRWQFLPDGRLIPRVEGPCVLGGLHGDETALPQQMHRLLERVGNYEGFIINKAKTYFNCEVNEPALKRGIRGIPDINRQESKQDKETQGIKENVRQEIEARENAFVLDMHNFNLEAKDSEAVKPPFAFTIEDSQENLLFKIRLAQELGFDKLIIVPKNEITDGFVIGKNGISAEVDINDKENTSSKIALRFLAMNGVVNDGSLTSGLQMQLAFRSRFLPANQEMQIYRYQECPETLQDGFQEEKDVLYQVINGLPIKITKLILKNNEITKFALSEKDKEWFC